MKKRRSLFRLLKAGDVLVRTLHDGREQWRLARAGLEVDAAQRAVLMKRSFLGGRMKPAGDQLPGFDPGVSQSWRWTKNAPRKPRPAPPEIQPAELRP